MRQMRFTINNMARNQCDAAAEISRLQHHVEPWTVERFVEFNRGPSQTCWVAMDNWKPTEKQRVCG